jgi:type II secretory pathway component PulK
MRSQKTRRGIMVLAVLFSLTVLAMLTVVWLRLIAAERQYLKQQLGAQQAELLALSALDRAEARLAADADYAGETWTPEASSLGPGAEAG